MGTLQQIRTTVLGVGKMWGLRFMMPQLGEDVGSLLLAMLGGDWEQVVFSLD